MNCTNANHNRDEVHCLAIKPFSTLHRTYSKHIADYIHYYERPILSTMNVSFTQHRNEQETYIERNTFTAYNTTNSCHRHECNHIRIKNKLLSICGIRSQQNTARMHNSESHEYITSNRTKSSLVTSQRPFIDMTLCRSLKTTYTPPRTVPIHCLPRHRYQSQT